MRRHRGAVATLVLAGASAFAGAVYVFLWFVSSAQASGMAPSTLGIWTMGNLVRFILYAVFWELLLVGVPVAVAAAAFWQWWRRLPDGGRRGGYRFGGGSRSTGGGGGFSLLLFIAFCIKVYIDGKWDVAIATFTLNYVVDSMVTILVWGLVIIGIPAAMALTWWIRREMKA
jgi:hypothetical protein